MILPQVPDPSITERTALPMDLPLIRPHPPKLSQLTAGLEAIEASGTFSNNGPVARRFEQAATNALFGGRGACLAVANATLGLMIALKQATLHHDEHRRLALMPAFTFAATGQAALWAGMTPLLADCDPDDWSLCHKAEERLLAEHGRRIGVILPYATFGNSIDLERYAWLARRHDVAVVVDAAASLGSLDGEGRGFGTGSPFPVVYSMHATKTFATSEGGLIHCDDAARIERLRVMANFGFERSRSATLPGLNAKLGEVSALIAEAKLDDIAAVVRHRNRLGVLLKKFANNLATRQDVGNPEKRNPHKLLADDPRQRRDAVNQHKRKLENGGFQRGRAGSHHPRRRAVHEPVRPAERHLDVAPGGHHPHRGRQRLGGRRRLEPKLGPRFAHFRRRLEHHRENPRNLLLTTAGE